MDIDEGLYQEVIRNKFSVKKDFVVTKKFLADNPDCVFVFGDNEERRGLGGAAKLRNMPNSYGLITKKYPNRKTSSYYTVSKYRCVWKSEAKKLYELIELNPLKTFYISKVGSGLANKFGIFENIIEPNIKFMLSQFKNVVFLW